MEIIKKDPAWLNEAHPNYDRWKRARDLSIARGRFVESIINQHITADYLSVLDLGSGEGGTSKVFSENYFVVSFDLSLLRLQRQKKLYEQGESLIFYEKPLFNIGLVNGDAHQLPFKDNSFELLIIQDVIEHVNDITHFCTEIKRVLKPEGIIFLSTPNKQSLFNFISDPHFGLPVVSILKRNLIKKYFLRYFRKNDYERTDIAQLLSLTELKNIFGQDFEILIHTKFSVQELFNGNEGIVWSAFHIKLISFCRLIKIDSLIIRIANDKFGIVNKYFTPTFYLILKKLT